MGANTANLQVGRLLEIRVAGYSSVDDVDRFFDAVEREVATLPRGGRHVTVADWRQCALMAPEPAARVAVRIGAFNNTTLRSAALARSDAPTAVLQFLRVIREAALPDRKLFFDEAQMTDWLSEVLTPDEAERLKSFVAAGD